MASATPVNRDPCSYCGVRADIGCKHMNKQSVTIIPALSAAAQVKSLDDVKADMSELYEELRSGAVEVKLASELANITGKYLKAEQLKLAREIFQSHSGLLKIGNG
jgi:hypothetical protein